MLYGGLIGPSSTSQSEFHPENPGREIENTKTVWEDGQIPDVRKQPVFYVEPRLG